MKHDQMLKDPFTAPTVAASLISQAQTKPEAAVLRVVQRWYPKAKTKRDGHTWFIHSASDFQRSGVSYQEDTIWRAVRALEKREILTVKRRFHPFKRGPIRVYWIRPTNWEASQPWHGPKEW